MSPRAAKAPGCSSLGGVSTRPPAVRVACIVASTSGPSGIGWPVRSIARICSASVDAGDDLAVYTAMARPTAFTAGRRCAWSASTSTIPALPADPRSAPATTLRTLSARAGEL